MEANIFSIQRTSFVDGPGVRTTVFFKGCNLHCLWCHNPESQLKAPQILYYSTRCTGCGACLEICPAIKTDRTVDQSKCVACGRCEAICVNNARELSGHAMSPQEVLAEIIPDRSYYKATGGGVTFSGGECMLYPDFLEEMLRLCQEEGINAAVDTAGHVPFAFFEKLLPYEPLFLYDLKAFDRQVHQRLTGVDNHLILKNYTRLHSACPGRLFVRIPIIPNWNDMELPALARWLRKYPPAQIELLAYHRFGISKSQAIQRVPFEAEEPTAQQMEDCQALFEGLPLCVNGGSSYESNSLRRNSS